MRKMLSQSHPMLCGLLLNTSLTCSAAGVNPLNKPVHWGKSQFFKKMQIDEEKEKKKPSIRVLLILLEMV